MSARVVWMSAVSSATKCSECDEPADKWAGRDKYGRAVALCNQCSDWVTILRRHEERVAPEYLVQGETS